MSLAYDYKRLYRIAAIFYSGIKETEGMTLEDFPQEWVDTLPWNIQRFKGVKRSSGQSENGRHPKSRRYGQYVYMHACSWISCTGVNHQYLRYQRATPFDANSHVNRSLEFMFWLRLYMIINTTWMVSLPHSSSFRFYCFPSVYNLIIRYLQNTLFSPIPPPPPNFSNS